jgi:Fic family protein
MAAEGKLGYQYLIDQLQLTVRPLARHAALSTAVNRRVETETHILFPRGVAIENSTVGHLEFALRHEGINLEVIDAAFDHINPADLIARLKQAPNGEYIRRACFLWEWLTGKALEAGVSPTVGYVALFPPQDYLVASSATRNQTYRIDNNALGTAAFCPVVRKSALEGATDLDELLREASAIIHDPDGEDLYDRAVHYLYLSETRSSFAIEHEMPTGSKEDRFVQLLKRAGEKTTVTEDWLVELQNAIVRDVFSQEASYRTRQNWLADSNNRITYFPPATDDMRRAMAGWEAFVNDCNKGIDPLVKAACASFGFVYLHPFMDGNGRLHRFMIHQVLAQSGRLDDDIIIPVSAVIMKNIPDYLAVLTGFSKPTRTLWDYRRGEDEPHIITAANSRSYRFFEADREVAFLHRMIEEAVREEIPNEMAYLRGYDKAFNAIEREFDLPQKDVSSLIRMVKGNNGVLSNKRRKQYLHIPEQVLNRIVEIINAEFNAPKLGSESTNG